MKKQIWMCILGAALILGAARVAPGAARPGAAQTSTKKKKSSSKSKRKSKVRAQTAPTPDRIREIQSALQREGAYSGEPTGKWDDATVDAMKSYQDKNGLPSTGKIDALTLEKLGLGSDTAGKGAPLPIAPSSAPSADPPAK